MNIEWLTEELYKKIYSATLLFWIQTNDIICILEYNTFGNQEGELNWLY